ncbi:unnamed protein product [Prorocentrum cordatum]|uniref:Protein xylosyltransferase n=1 Tax=Prorocentrum cordatum TaxID=2364126 RepID=A0ABN9T238_9DINO|nr:unnamed protein product [Polarella glacialis]
MPGNPGCFDGAYTFDLCCDTAAHGPQGNTECWLGDFTFGRCCGLLDPPAQDPAAEGPAWTSAECWAGPEALLRASGIPGAQAALTSLDALEGFCCGLQHNPLCWSDRAELLVRDGATDEPLGFTEQYARCCFARAQRGAIEHCDFTESAFGTLLQTVNKVLHVLRELAPLPPADFFVHADEALCMDWAGSGAGFELPVPVLAQAKPRSGCPAGLLMLRAVTAAGMVRMKSCTSANHRAPGCPEMPWWATLSLDWSRRTAGQVMSQGLEVPWGRRAATLFWRGSDTGCLLPGGCAAPSAPGPTVCSCSDWSATYRAVDAKFTKDSVHAECRPAYLQSDLHVDQLVPPSGHLEYKYLMYVDVFSSSIVVLGSHVLAVADGGCGDAPDLAASGVAGSRPAPPRALLARAGGDLGDLVDVLEWARGHDLECEGIAAEARRFARSELSLDASLFYIHRLLGAYAGLFGPRGAEGRPPAARPPPQPRGGPGGRGDPACWGSGFTPALCCDLGRGPRGDEACWGAGFTFERCCVGPAPSGATMG